KQAADLNVIDWLHDWWSSYRPGQATLPLLVRVKLIGGMEDGLHALEKRDEDMLEFLSVVAKLLTIHINTLVNPTTLDELDWQSSLRKVLHNARRVFIDRIQKSWNRFKKQLSGTPEVATAMDSCLKEMDDLLDEDTANEEVAKSTINALV